jgi:protein involved in polysaccharide export with SLBB domain
VAKHDQPETAPNGTEKGDLTPKQEAAALALASGRTLADAAKASGAGQRTIKTWNASLPAFPRRINELRAEMTSRAVGRLADGMASAAETLGFLSRRGRSEMVRLSAARTVLELGNKLRETVELEERIAALESSERRVQ